MKHLAAAQAHLPLDRSLLVEHAADLARQVDIHELMAMSSDRPAAVGGNEIEDRRHRRREAADDEVPVEEHRRDLRALEQVAQVRVAAIELVDLAGELVVDGVQLLVDGLQLLLGGFQLLVGGLQLLVDGDQLLVAGLQLLERGFVFLDGRLQAIARFAQLVLQAGDVAVLAARLLLRGLLASQRPAEVA